MSKRNGGDESAVSRRASFGRLLRRWMRRGVVAAVAILLVYVVLVVQFYTGRPNIARNFSAEFNATFAGVPESERAWPVYRDAYLKMPWVADQLEESETLAWPRVPVQGPGAERVLQLLAASEETILLVQRAAALPTFGRDISDLIDPVHEQRLAVAGLGLGSAAGGQPSSNPVLIDVMLDHLGVLRQFMWLLRADVRRAAAHGDGDRVYGNLVAILGMADHADQSIGLISQRTAFTLHHVAIDGLAEAMGIDADLLTEVQLEDLVHRLGSFSGGGRPALRLDEERDILLDIAQRLFTDDGSGDGRVCYAGLRHLSEILGSSLTIGQAVLGPVHSHRFGSRKDFVSEVDRMLDMARKDVAKPIWERSGIWELEQGLYLGCFNHTNAALLQHVIEAMVPAILSTAFAAEAVRLDRDGALVGLAVELHRRRTGEYPEFLTELSALLPDGLPLDWIDGQPLRYVRRDGRGVIYSLGPDGEDDGGRTPGAGTGGMFERRLNRGIPAVASSQEAQRWEDRDLVLWPRWPERAPVPASPDEAK